ncbi:MAG: efflux RND transporter periplasmic adaptor subunit [Acidobacteriota bacterium]
MESNGNWKRILWPVIGVALLALVVLQARAATARKQAEARSVTAATAPVSRAAAEGRLVTYPGAQAVVGTDLGGTIVSLPVREKDRVRKGELLAELRSDDYRASLAEARARIEEADADIRLFQAEVERARQLWNDRVGTRQALDRAERDLDAGRARRETAAATARRLEAVLAKTRITAPLDGVVIARHAEPGETVEAGSPLVTVADLSRTRVEAEFDEFDAGRVRVGAPARVTAEGYDGKFWTGVVEEIPDAVSGRRLKPQDPGKPEDTRVLLVKIALKEATPLKLGQRVEVAVDTQ